MLAVATLLTVAGCAGPAESQDDSKITIAVGPTYWETPVRHAIAEGWFTEAGLEVTEVKYGPESEVPIVVSGQADIGVTGLGTVITSVAAGVDIQAVAGQLVEGDNVEQQLTALVAAAGSGITDLKGLEGRRVAVNALKSPSAAQLMARMAEAGADGRTVQFIAVPFPGMVEALGRGDVDAAVTPVPFTGQAISKGGARISSVSPVGSPVPVYFAQSDFNKRRPDVAAKFMAVLKRAYTWANQNRDEVVAQFAKEANLPLEAAQLMPAMLWQAEFDEPGVVANIEDMRTAGYLTKDLTFDDVVLAELNKADVK